MAGPVHVRCLICLAVVAVSHAEPPAVAPADPQPAPAVPAPAEQASSPKLDKLFAGNPPKFDPAKAAAAPTPLPKPQNGIIRLPTYLVREPRPIRSEDVMTNQARAEALVKRYDREPTGLDLMLNKYTLGDLWNKIPVLGKISTFGTSMSYNDRIATEYARYEAKRKWLEALGVSADMPPTKEASTTAKEPSHPDDK